MTYGCHNRPLLPPSSERFSQRCNYDRRERDAGCDGCRFRVREKEGGEMTFELVDQDGEIMANARLIAAAPELLEVCQQLVAWCDKNPPAGEALYFVQLAREAVAKATSEK